MDYVLDPKPPSKTIDIPAVAIVPATPTTPAVAAIPATTGPNPEYTLWKRRDKFVLLWLKSTLADHAATLVGRTKSSSEAWRMLETLYQAQTRACRMQLKVQLQTLAKENLHPVHDEDLIGYILGGLDASYGAFVTAFMMKTESLTVNDLVGFLLQEEARLEQEHLRLAAVTQPQIAALTRRPVCQLCSKVGHEAIDCWQWGNQTDFPSRKPNPRQNPRQAHLVQQHSPSTVIDPSWYFDTGATDHASPDITKLNIAEPYTGDDKLQVGNGNHLSISHTGSSTLPNLKLPNVLIVPEITKNLLSVSKLTEDNDVFMEFWPKTCSVKSFQGQTLLRGDKKEGLYRVPHHRVHSPKAFHSSRISLHGWHRRLAHPHESILRRLVSTFHLPVSTNKFPNVCDSCQLGKSHMLHLPTSHVASSKPFELIYSDVWGPSPVFSLNGHSYFVFFMDDCTKFVWVYFLSHKSQVYSTFLAFKTMIKTQFSCDIKSVQSDWGGEYQNVSRFLNTHGIEHRVSCPYTQEQNGAIERRNRIVVEKGLTLLAQSSLPQMFWEHAFKTATYLHNRTITPLLSYESPYQKLYQNIPDYEFLKTFGCLCYPYLRPYNQHKIDFRSKPCVFLGYSAYHKGYICYHPPTSKIYISRHVIFDEDTFPFHSLQTETNKSQPIPPTNSPTVIATLHSPPIIPSAPSENTTQISPINSPCITPPQSPNNFSPTPSNPSAQHNSPPTHSLQSTSQSPPNSPNNNSPISNPTPSPPSQNPTVSSRAPNTIFRQSETSQHPMVTRARTNSLKPKSFHTQLSSLTIEPRLFSQAVRHKCWQDAMKAEYDALMRNNTWSLVNCPTKSNIVGCKWIYRVKKRSDGTIERHKARLVAQGFSQEAGVDYFDTFSPVIKPTTIRLVLSIALSHGWNIHQLDINNAFLNGTNDQELQMFVSNLNQAFSLKDLGNLHFFLGLQIQKSKTGITLSQQSYISDIITRSNMSLSSPMTTPADPYSHLTKSGDPFDDPKLYPQIVGSLQYATITRLDIAYSANRIVKAEYRSLAYTTAELLWLKQLISDLQVPITGPPLLLCDNVGAIFMTKNPVISTRSKHIALDFHFIREQVEAGQLKICHVSSKDQLADLFTKPLAKDRIVFLRSKLQVHPTLELAGG
ncbi:hypothetical protein L1887_15941 [Cichorium endivia]|nr:hypothetical protein L1887_15941 [Cichorium endivia]